MKRVAINYWAEGFVFSNAQGRKARFPLAEISPALHSSAERRLSVTAAALIDVALVSITERKEEGILAHQGKASTF